MPDSSQNNNSFIPKRNPVKKTRTSKGRRLYILSIISYALFVSAPLMSGAVFIYERQTEKAFQQAQIDLDAAAATFSETDMKRVVEFDRRLDISAGLLNSHVSITALLEAVEEATIGLAQYQSLEINRTDDATLVVEASIETESFDTAIFQRGVYQRSDKISSIAFSDVGYSDGGGEGEQVSNAPRVIELEAELVFAVSNVLYNPVTETTNTQQEIQQEEPPAVFEDSEINETTL